MGGGGVVWAKLCYLMRHLFFWSHVAKKRAVGGAGTRRCLDCNSGSQLLCLCGSVHIWLAPAVTVVTAARFRTPAVRLRDMCLLTILNQSLADFSKTSKNTACRLVTARCDVMKSTRIDSSRVVKSIWESNIARVEMRWRYLTVNALTFSEESADKASVTCCGRVAFLLWLPRTSSALRDERQQGLTITD